MANLKDLLVKGPSNLIGDVTVNKIRLTSLEIPTSSSGSTYGLGSSGQILKTNGSSVYWADDVVSKLGTATIGSSSQPIYLNNGTPTAITGAIANDTTGNAATATTLATGRTLKVNLASTSASTAFDGSANINDIGVSGTLPVAQGGTGCASLDSGKVLIGNGTSAVTFRDIYTRITKGDLEWSDATSPYLLTKAALAYWDGSFNGTTSNITKVGIITSGTWNGTTIAVNKGGTGHTSFTGNRLIFSPTSTTFENAAKIYVKNETNADAYMAINKTSITSGYNFEVQGKSKFNGDIDLSITSGSEGRITRGEKTSSWYDGRDKAMLFLTSNQYYNVFASIKAGNSSEAITDRGSWDIGVTGYTASEHKFKLLFSYITDDNYTNGTSSTLPTAQIRFTPDGAIEADNFIGNMRRPGKTSAWWEGRDKAIISMTSNSNSGYNPFISIKADGNGTDSTLMGSWDIGVNKYRSDRQNQLIFSYITDTVYTNHTNTLPSGQIRFCPDGSILGATWTGNTVGVAYGGTGKSTFIPNRLLYTSGSTSLAECTMYASSTQLAINTTSMIDEADTFEVNGMSYLAGEVITDGTISPVENGIYDLGTEDYRWNKIYVNKFDPDVFLQNINVTLSSTWQNIQNNGADIELPYDGTYIIQIYDNTTSVGHYQTYWSGIFSWYTGNISGITNSNGYEYSEISLHGSGQAINAKNIYLRTYSQNSSKMKLQIKGNNNLTSSTSNVISIKIKYIM